MLETINSESISIKLERQSVEFIGGASKPNSSEIENLTTKIREIQESHNDLETCLAEVKTGMVKKIQQAIDDFKKDKSQAEDEACKRESEWKKLQEDQEEQKKLLKKIFTPDPSLNIQSFIRYLFVVWVSVFWAVLMFWQEFE